MLGFLCYLMLLPVFTFMFQIYAVCNLHDVSWGNRPTSSSAQQDHAKAASDYIAYRTNFVIFYILINVAQAIPIIVTSELNRHPEIGEV